MKKFSLETKSLSKTSDRKLIDNLKFSASSGEMHAIIGNNGEGKTVFSQVLAGVRSKASGQIFIDGREVFYHDTLSAQSNGF